MEIIKICSTKIKKAGCKSRYIGAVLLVVQDPHFCISAGRHLCGNTQLIIIRKDSDMQYVLFKKVSVLDLLVRTGKCIDHLPKIYAATYMYVYTSIT